MSSQKNATTRPLGDARFVDFHNDVVTIETTQALPPGSRISFFLSMENLPQPLHLHGKVARVEPVSEVTSRLVVRLHSLTKDQRTTLSNKT